MNWKKISLTYDSAKRRMAVLRAGAELKPVEPLSPECQTIRSAVISALDAVADRRARRDYAMDVELGLSLHSAFPPDEALGPRRAADEGLWRFMTLNVFPDQTARRWQMDQEDRWWTNKRRRLWPMQCWWYVYLGWQGSVAETRNVLMAPCFSTDTIVQVVERSGSHRVGLTRELFKQLPSALAGTSGEEAILRRVFAYNTAKLMVTQHELGVGGVAGYASTLLRSATTISVVR